MVLLLTYGLNASAVGTSDKSATANQHANNIRTMVGMEAAVKANKGANGPKVIQSLASPVTYAPPGIGWDEMARECLACRDPGVDEAVAIARKLPKSNPNLALVLLECDKYDLYQEAGEAALAAFHAGSAPVQLIAEALQRTHQKLKSQIRARDLVAQLEQAMSEL